MNAALKRFMGDFNDHEAEEKWPKIAIYQIKVPIKIFLLLAAQKKEPEKCLVE